jgi:hypothetical protein
MSFLLVPGAELFQQLLAGVNFVLHLQTLKNTEFLLDPVDRPQPMHEVRLRNRRKMSFNVVYDIACVDVLD